MTRDIRLTIGYLLATVALGALINSAAVVMHARGATMDLSNESIQSSRSSHVRHARHHRQIRHVGRSHRVSRAHVVHALDPRPRAWCGWYMRQKLGMRDRSLNLARNWARVGRPAQPAPGVIVVWNHHVGRIVAVLKPGIAIVESGNDGRRVRVRARSIANAIAFREV